MPFRYRIVVQWSSLKQSYEAYVPALLPYIQDFLPSYTKACYGPSPQIAVEKAMESSKVFLQKLDSLCILPPESDVFKKSLLKDTSTPSRKARANG